MNNVTKLTPQILKRIIAEEKKKLNLGKKAKKSKSISNDQIVEAYMKCLKLLRERQDKKTNDLKKIQKIKQALKSKLIKRL